MKKTKRIAFCGLMAALSAVLLTLGGVLPLSTFVCPVLAMLPVAVSLEEAGKKGALGVYLSAAFLGMILCADREAAVFYLLCGGYPILQRSVEKIRRPAAFAIKALAVNAALILTWLITTKLLGIEDSGATGWLLALTWLLGNAVFLLLDKALDKLAVLYRLKWRKNLFFRE